MRIFALIVLLSLSLCAQGELFKWKDADGNIIYSDQPPPGIEKEQHQIDEQALPQLTTTPALETPIVSSSSDPDPDPLDSPDRYQSVQIVVPEHDTAVRENAGNVSIKVAIEPFLYNERGDLLAIYMDGVEVSRGRSLSVQLAEVDRGTHVIRAEILDAKGNIVMSASPVTFTLLRHSALF